MIFLTKLKYEALIIEIQLELDESNVDFRIYMTDWTK